MQPPIDRQGAMIAALKTIVPPWLWNPLGRRSRPLRKWYREHRLRDYSQSGETRKIRRLLHKKRGEAGFFDYDLLITLDFEQYRPKVVVTEDYEPKNAAKFRLLERVGYSFVKRVGCNTFWLDGLKDRRGGCFAPTSGSTRP